MESKGKSKSQSKTAENRERVAMISKEFEMVSFLFGLNILVLHKHTQRLV